MYNSVFNRKTDLKNSTRKRRPRKKKSTLRAGSTVQKPLWELTYQKAGDYFEQYKVVKEVYENSGRDNPFSFPDSVLLRMRQIAEAELMAKKEPDTFRKKAYRATLVGILKSEAKDDAIALVSLQEATFDVLDGTGKNKVLKLATKAMSRSQKKTQELFQGGYIGPWEITKIVPPVGFRDPKIILEKGDEVKIMTLDKTEELGIFNEAGELDNLDDYDRKVSLGDDDDDKA